MAKAGRKVCVIERNHSVGGAASAFKKGALNIEPALHQTADPRNPSEPKHEILKELGLLEEIDWVPVSPGGVFIKGGSRTLSTKMAKIVMKSGGSVLLGREAVGIDTDAGGHGSGRPSAGAAGTQRWVAAVLWWRISQHPAAVKLNATILTRELLLGKHRQN